MHCNVTRLGNPKVPQTDLTERVAAVELIHNVNYQ